VRDATVDLISEYAASLTCQDVGPKAVHAVKRSLIDSIGCALAAYAAEPVKIARRMAARVRSDAPASLIGSFIKTSPEMAAFVNGAMVRYLDFSDDYLNNDGPHPSDNIAAVMAACEAVNANGKALVCGIALAYEIVGQLVDIDLMHEMSPLNGWLTGKKGRGRAHLGAAHEAPGGGRGDQPSRQPFARATTRG